MASFSTHLGGAAIVSAMASSLLVVTSWASFPEALILFLLGMLGGILPDIDSDTSRPVVWVFNCLGSLAAGVALWLLLPHANASWTSLATVWGGMALAYALAGPAAMELFTRLTVHRGVIHSLLAAFCCGLLTVVIIDQLFDRVADFCWIGGGFVTGGFVVHLLLDELYAVDFNGMRLKKSFGTAIKPISLVNWRGTIVLLITCGVLYQVAPAPMRLTQPVQSLIDQVMTRIPLVGQS
ncbi:metal-dependent hydrolase [Oceanobacter sp. 5_MG-2023]|uniref:metal-dependent hydrolase n=1 Tax=Oceanobacter sp. 5_MG-2023 TaxID=3062645 RepID=UPI0026E1C69A|nr:metal-dependent hydrolase [Oceanobacter sp. 5_MG-2023]MDO6682871.1 metal-dependent hydrolase [Oceanobacter sp. 5_MG-2023]